MLVAVALALGLSRALASSRPPTLKIVSQYRDESLSLRGSGLGFCYQGRAYVVTSDHVLLHGDDNAIHTVTLAAQKLPAHYLASDFGHGLGLLAINNADSLCTSWPALETMPIVNLERNQNAAMLGYPAMSDNLLRDVTGHVSDAAVDRGLFVQQPRLIEISGGHAEFGMSGGVVTNTSGEFAGLLSHQTYSENADGIQNTIFVIPAAEVASWLRGYFADPDGNKKTTPISLVQSTSQLVSTLGPSASSGNLFFSYLDAFSNGRHELIITLSDSSSSRLYADPPGDLSLYSISKKDCVFYVVRFRKRGVVGSSGASVASFTDALRLLARPDLEPVTLLSCNDSDQAIDALAPIYTQVQDLLNRQHVEGTENLVSALSNDLEFIHNQDPYRGMGTYFEVKPSDIERLESDAIYASAWGALRANGLYSEWHQALDRWIEAMRALAI